MVKSGERWTEDCQAKGDTVAVDNVVETDLENKENKDLLTCADAVKKGPANRRLSPLIMGGAEPHTGY